MKQPPMNREQQQRFPFLLTAELDKMTMSWDNDLKEWYPVAIEALRFASTPQMQIPQSTFIKLFDQDKMGLNMNCVMRLCNNLEARSANEMNYLTKDWALFLLKNQIVADRWIQLSEPAHQKIYKIFEEETRKVKIMAGVPNNMKLIK